MDTEEILYTKVIEYLNSLGYGSENIKVEYPIQGGRRIDLVVKSGDKNLIAIEVKHKTDVFAKSSAELGYDSFIRRLQVDAADIDAKLYIISDGKQHKWLKTNAVGRPEVIEPIPASEVGTKKLSDSEFIIAMLEHAESLLRNFPITGDISLDMSVAIFSQLHKELGLDFPEMEDVISEKKLDYSKLRSSLDEVLERWQNVQLLSNKIAVLYYIDQFLNKNSGDWLVPRWLANLLVDLYPETPDGMALDLFARHGVITSSAQLKGWKHVDALFFNRAQSYWVKLQQLLTSNGAGVSLFEENLLDENPLRSLGSKYNCVFLSPPFGFRIYSAESGIKKDSSEILINKAISTSLQDGYVIAIVPDGVLLSARFMKLRKILTTKTSLRAVINLSPDTFKPHSSVSTSILVIQNSSPKKDHSIFFASLEEVPVIGGEKGKIDISEILRNWFSFLAKENFEPSKKGIGIQTPDIKNLHFSNYWFQEGTLKLQAGYQAIPLKEVVKKIRRGRPYKQAKSKEGIPFIGPAAVRKMKFLEDGLSFTTKQLIPPNPLIVQTGDVIVNIIGTHRGSASIVNEPFNGLGINHHLVALTPKTNLVRPYYLALALNSDYVQQQLREGASGTVIPALRLQSFESIKIPVPPIAIQDQICEEYQDWLQKVGATEMQLNQQRNKLREILADIGKGGTK